MYGFHGAWSLTSNSPVGLIRRVMRDKWTNDRIRRFSCYQIFLYRLVLYVGQPDIIISVSVDFFV